MTTERTRTEETPDSKLRKIEKSNSAHPRLPLRLLRAADLQSEPQTDNEGTSRVNNANHANHEQAQHLNDDEQQGKIITETKQNFHRVSVEHRELEEVKRDRS